jgi:hypothetical protein
LLCGNPNPLTTLKPQPCDHHTSFRRRLPRGPDVVIAIVAIVVVVAAIVTAATAIAIGVTTAHGSHGLRFYIALDRMLLVVEPQAIPKVRIVLSVAELSVAVPLAQLQQPLPPPSSERIIQRIRTHAEPVRVKSSHREQLDHLVLPIKADRWIDLAADVREHHAVIMSVDREGDGVRLAVEYKADAIILVDLGHFPRLALTAGVQPAGVASHHPKALGVVVAATSHGLNCAPKTRRLIVLVILRHHHLPAPHPLA